MKTIDTTPTLWEAGHYYTSKGPTFWSLEGWKLMEQLKQENDPTMLFIDDIHPCDALHPDEKNAQTLPFNPKADFTVLESAMTSVALDVLQELKGLSKRRKAKQSKKTGTWFLSSFPLTHPDGRPLCVLLDAALSVYKHQLGFENSINVLPSHYHGQQENLKKILERILPEFKLQTLFFKQGGTLLEPCGISVPFKTPSL